MFEDADEDLVERPPVVTIMGHVDHGKTSLLDAIRETEVAAGEAGGITQHIGAYQVRHAGKAITFLDTPGHEAFTAMRARGARVTDIAVIVVAADDGVKPQTEEAIDHARAADVPIVVAVNKIDKEGAAARPRAHRDDPARAAARGVGRRDRVRRRLARRPRQGLDDLLETIQVVAELEELRANRGAEASGAVIESKLDPGRGPVVTLLIQRGTLHVGDALVAGAHFGRVRAMHDFIGARVKQRQPGRAGRGARLRRRPRGRRVRARRRERAPRAPARGRARQPPEDRGARAALRPQDLARGRLQARPGGARSRSSTSCSRPTSPARWRRSRTRSPSCPQDEVTVNIIHRGVGGINESDVMLAAASDGVILAFNVRPVGDARALAEREGVEIRSYAVIYRAIEELRAAMQGMLEPEEVETTLGQAEVRQTVPRLAHRHDRRLRSSPRAGSRAARRCAWCATAP